MPRRKKKTFRITRKQWKALCSLAAAVVLLISSIYSLASSGELREILGLPSETPSVTMPEGTLNVYYLDVGQGDSELLCIPTGEGDYHTVLIDAGDNGYEDQLLDQLYALGIHRIDTAIFTHPHADHIGGAAEVIRALDVGLVYMPPVPASMTPTTATYEAMLDAMLDKGVGYKEATAGMVLYEGEGVSLKVLSPRRGDTWDDLNNWSVVTLLEYGESRFLFTGDAETVSERAILESGEDITCTVLKMGHHGSSTSSSYAFLNAARPQYAIVSCGKDNSYGHPHRETVRTLQERGIPWYRTDEDGTILVTSDGSSISILPHALGR